MLKYFVIKYLRKLGKKNIINGQNFVGLLNDRISIDTLVRGDHENEAKRLLVKNFLSKKRNVALDIGAHIGLTTLPISSQIKKNSNIFSFEPSNINRKYLNFHLFINNIKNVTVIDTLVGKSNSKNINFYESKKPTGMNSIINIKENHSLIKKNQISLDNFVNEKKLNQI